MLVTRRSLIVIACLAIIGYLIGQAAAPIVKEIRREIAYAQIGGGLPRFEHYPKQSKEYNEYMDWLYNDLARQREPWSVEDAAILMAVIDARYTQEYVENYAWRPEATIPDQEPMQIFRHTKGVITERLGRNEPIDPEARVMLEIALIDALEDSYWDIRLGAVQAVCHARLVTDPAIRAKIEALYNDPNEQVAANARNQLAWFDEEERLRAEGKWYTPWIKD